MSHYTKIQTCFKEQKYLLAALKDMGFSDVEVHDTPQTIYGYLGDERTDTAHVIVRRQHVGQSSNDIGFLRNTEGIFEASISEFDRDELKYDGEWLGKLSQRYAYHATLDQVKKQGFQVRQEKQDGGKIRLTLDRRTW
jgi:hypothetical protein